MFQYPFTASILPIPQSTQSQITRLNNQAKNGCHMKKKILEIKMAQRQDFASQLNDGYAFCPKLLEPDKENTLINQGSKEIYNQMRPYCWLDLDSN